ncbi:hypothetical protein [Oceanicella actignis]|uniref:Mu-like prophage protein gp37 n=1 Tax=Oceanicella actignis TaxID=1189325 RepID=A0A1M7U1Q8_9RHOB|nr:hypothetical protein [Oceanicella actignis]SES77099.1 hypothetical protein SAMN04488119_101413 [Oceanicella actignis]SHN76843.1 hypothetical protein SAMN05216200_1149 [Oceanicella actignis]
MAGGKRKLILDAVRARIAVAWPDAVDRTEEPEAAAADRLPAFWVAAAEREREPRAMNAPGAYIVQDEITVAAQVAGRGDMESRLSSLACGLADVLAAPPARLGGLAQYVDPAGFEVSVGRGERRVGTVEARFLVQFVTDQAPPHVPGGAFDEGYSEAFD